MVPVCAVLPVKSTQGGAFRYVKPIAAIHEIMHKLGMAISSPRRYLFPALAGLLVLVLALWQWMPKTPVSANLAAGRGVNTVGWTTTQMTLAGRTDPNATGTLIFNDKEYPIAVDDKGAFVVTARAEQKSPTRATLKLGKDTYSVLLLRLQGNWIALQRVTDGPSMIAGGDRGWMPAAGLYEEDAPPETGILTAAHDERGYVITLAAPGEHTTYVYGNNRLTGVIKRSADATPSIATLPDNTTQLRLDIYDSADRLTQRLRMTLPPPADGPRYTLSDGDVWVFTDFSAQKGEVDEQFPGQFVPVTHDEPSDAAKAATPQDKAAPAARNEAAR